MSIEITHVRFGGTKKTEDEIFRYKWRGKNGEPGDNDKPSMVAWVDQGNSAFVSRGPGRVSVGVVKPTNTQPYLRPHAGGNWTNSLLALPTF